MWDFLIGKGTHAWPEPDGRWETYAPKASLSPDAATAVTLYREPSLRTLPDGGLSIGGGTKKEVFLWDGQTGRASKTKAVQAEGTIVFSPDGKWLVADDPQKNVIIWDAQTGKLLRKLTGTPGSPIRLLVSADRKYIVASCLDDKKYPVMVWDANTGAVLHKLNAQRTFVRARRSCQPRRSRSRRASRGLSPPRIRSPISSSASRTSYGGASGSGRSRWSPVTIIGHRQLLSCPPRPRRATGWL